MPGLIGIVWGGEAEEGLLERMAKSLQHGEGQRIERYSDSYFGGSRVDLGIFNGGVQPVFNEGKDKLIFFHGKIYEYREKRKELERRGHRFGGEEDGEYCLHAYEEWGEGFVEGLNGSFVLLIYDLVKKKVIVMNDRFGFRPLYRAKVGKKWIVASEVKAILEDRGFKRVLNEGTLADFLGLKSIMGNKTFFEGIETLSPASILEYGEGGVEKERRYWDLRYGAEYGVEEEEFVEELGRVLKRAMGRCMGDKLR